MNTNYIGVVFKSKGVVSKVGGVLSHMAVVCREFGIPAVICPEADELVGRYISLDSSEGELHVYYKS